ncbi:MAG: hypothetical protein RSD29_02800 [Bacilli bacterium]
MSKNCLELYKSGTFYNIYGDDGLIIHKLMGYKYIEYKKSVGFPAVALDKVKNILEDNKISYVILDKKDVLSEYKGIDNMYDKALASALKDYDIEKRSSRLLEIVNNCNEEELKSIFEFIEGLKNGEK